MSDFRPNVTGVNAGEVRHVVDADRLNAYIKDHVPALKAPVTIKQFKHGQSNPTYLLQDQRGNRFVLRKKPPGTLISNSAHNVEREYAILNALQLHNKIVSGNPQLVIPVPPVYMLCTDASVIGSAFYIMKFVEGRIFTDCRLVELPKEERAEYWYELARAQARLARVDPKKLELPSTFAPPADFFERQAKSMSRLARTQAEVADVDTAVKIGLMPGFDEVAEYFRKTRPVGANVFGIAHGDFKMDNVIYHPTESRIIAILDWELCTIGPPICDFINGIAPYLVPSYPSQPFSDAQTLGFQGTDPTEEGLPTLDDLLKVWCRESGTPYPVKYFWWVAAWYCWKGAVISQGIGARHALRQASSADAQRWGEKRFGSIRMAQKYLGLDAISRVLDTPPRL